MGKAHMGFSVLQDPRCKTQFCLKGNLFLHSMSLVGAWSENIYQLRKSLGSSCNFNLLSFSTCATTSAVGTGRCKSRSIAAKIDGNHKKLQGCKSCEIRLKLIDKRFRTTTKLNLNKSELQELKGIQYSDVQQKPADSIDLGRLATIFVFDIETTGFSRQTDRIIEFALQDLLGGKNSTLQTLVNPERYVPNSGIHGISTHMVCRPGVPRWKDLVPILLQYVRIRQKAGGPVLWVAHNGRRFDVPFIIREFNRCSMEVPPDWLFLDTLPLARQLVKSDGSKLSSATLEALREYYGIPLLGSAHRAMSDVNSLSLILQKMTFDLKLPISGLLERSFKASDIPQVHLSS